MTANKCHNPFCRTHGMNGDKSYQDHPDYPYSLFQSVKVDEVPTPKGYLGVIRDMLSETASTNLPAPDDTDDIFSVETVGTNSAGDTVVRDQNGKLYLLLEL